MSIEQQGELLTLPETELLTVPETAKALRLEVSTIRSWILKKKLTNVKLGGRVFVKRSELDALIAAGVRPAKAAA